jgi:hypothetical protein
LSPISVKRAVIPARLAQRGGLTAKRFSVHRWALG